MVCHACGWAYRVDDTACSMCGVPRAFAPGEAPQVAPTLWSPSARYFCPPSDVSSLGPAPEGRVRLAGLDLDAVLPPGAAVESTWLGTMIRFQPMGREPWAIRFQVDSPLSNIGDARRALTRDAPRRCIEALRRSETTRDGWVMVGTLSWDRKPYPVMTMRRRIGEMTVDLTSDDPGLDEEVLEGIAKSLTPVPGGVTEWRMPEGPMVLRVAYGWGCFGVPKGAVCLFADGTAHYTGPRWRTVRGALARQDPAIVAELHARLTASPCCAQPAPGGGGRPIDLGVRVGDAWIHCGGHDIEERFREIEACVDLAAV